MHFAALSPYSHSTAPTTTGQSSLVQLPSTLPVTSAPVASQIQVANQGGMFPTQQRTAPQSNQLQLPALSGLVHSQTVAREKARISTLLEINSALLQEMVNLQAAGMAGPTPAQPASHQPSPTQDHGPTSPISATEQSSHTVDSSKGLGNKPSPEYLECMRRLQANLAYLVALAERAKKSGVNLPPAPAFMTPPPNLPGLNDLYVKLGELFPGAHRAASGTSQQHQRPVLQTVMQGNGGVSSMSVGESMV